MPVGRDDSARRLTGFRPAGRVPLPTAAKGPKRRQGWAPMGVPAHSRSTPGPPSTGDTPTPFRKISGAQNTVPGMIPSGPLGPDAVQNFGLFHFTAAPGSDQPWQRVRDRVCAGRSRFHEPGRAGQETRPYKAISVMGDTMAAAAYETDSVSPYAMKGPEIAVGTAPCAARRFSARECFPTVL